MRQSEVRKQISEHGLTWEAFEEFVKYEFVDTDVSGKNYSNDHVQDFINANKIEKKSKFFAQYWGQDVLYIPRTEQTWNVFSFQDEDGKDVVSESYLLLKPLSSITDEDAIFLKHQENIDAVKYYERWGVNSYDTDYLRSKGYALPYMGLSVEKLIEYGWVKLKNE